MEQYERDAAIMVDCLTRFMALAEMYSNPACREAKRMLALTGGDKNEVALLGAAIDFIEKVW